MTNRAPTDGLRSVGLQDHYRSDTDNMVRDFYEPALSVAARYDRAVGYFTSTSLALASNGVHRLAAAGGTIRLIASPHLTAEDVEQIELGYEYRAVIEAAIRRQLGAHVEQSPALLGKLGMLGRLVGEGILDIRIAIVRRDNRLALYHEKIGIFVDSLGDVVAFNGSSNETASALIDNFESVEVFQSWLPGDQARVQRLADDFDALWSGITAHVEVLDFPDLGKERLAQLAKLARDRNLNDPPPLLESGILIGSRAGSYPIPRIPSDITLREYQKDAIKKWFAANGRGVFEMATGTGKTVTALAAVTKMAEIYERQRKPLLAIVVAPQLDLVDQWRQTAESFGISALCCYDSAKSWTDAASALAIGLASRTTGFGMLITTNATMAREPFQDFLARQRAPFVFVADEAHNLGSASALAALPEFATHRMALTATPERWFDPSGTQALVEYFGTPVIQLGLHEAIRIGALCEYDYYPVPVTLNEDESELYAELTQRIGRLFASGAELDRSEDTGSQMSRLLQRRAQLLAHASGKLPALEEHLRARIGERWQLLYCAEGSPPLGGPRQIDAVLQLTGAELGIPSHPYTSAETRDERQRVLERFRRGDLHALVSMRCLDEGVDVPDARRAYILASTSNPRQFIQRRGRILRRSTTKDFAEIVDFIAVPAGHIDMNVERRLLRREIARFADFAAAARNAGEALATMRPIRETYGLMDM
jgi:superfamily II DNA or RNA helicase